MAFQWRDDEATSTAGITAALMGVFRTPKHRGVNRTETIADALKIYLDSGHGRRAVLRSRVCCVF